MEKKVSLARQTSLSVGHSRRLCANANGAKILSIRQGNIAKFSTKKESVAEGAVTTRTNSQLQGQTELVGLTSVITGVGTPSTRYLSSPSVWMNAAARQKTVKNWLVSNQNVFSSHCSPFFPETNAKGGGNVCQLTLVVVSLANAHPGAHDLQEGQEEEEPTRARGTPTSQRPRRPPRGRGRRRGCGRRPRHRLFHRANTATITTSRTVFPSPSSSLPPPSSSVASIFRLRPPPLLFVGLQC